MLTGAHVVMYSQNAEADRKFLREVMELKHIDEGGGYLIFKLPAAEASVHDAQSGPAHELYFMCEDIKAFIARMAEQRIACEPVHDAGWGLLTQVTLPSGGKLGVYQPRHRRP